MDRRYLIMLVKILQKGVSRKLQRTINMEVNEINDWRNKKPSLSRIQRKFGDDSVEETPVIIRPVLVERPSKARLLATAFSHSLWVLKSLD